MFPPVALHNTVGALFVGMILGSTLHGISVVQAWYYYTHQNDKWPLKSLVAAVMVCDTVHQAMVIYSVYFYAITNWGNPEQLVDIVWSLVVEVLFNALITLFIHSFLTIRLWRFSNHILLTTLTTVVVLAQFVTSITFVILVLRLDNFSQVGVLKPLRLSVIALTAVGDVLVAVAMCFMLHLSRTGIHRSNNVINKLILFAINTGLLTSLFAIASFVSYMAAPHTLLYIAFYSCLAGLYSNALLTNLNARKMISGNSHIHPSDTHGNVTLPLAELPKNRTTSKHGTANNISIKINTTREFVTDLVEQDHENEKVADSQMSGLTAGDSQDVKINNI